MSRTTRARRHRERFPIQRYMNSAVAGYIDESAHTSRTSINHSVQTNPQASSQTNLVRFDRRMPAVSSNVSALSDVQDNVTILREQLYELVKDSLATEEDVPIYGLVDKKKKVPETVPISFSVLRPWEWHRIGKEKQVLVEKLVQEEDVVGSEKKLVYHKPENLDNILPTVLNKAFEYLDAINQYTGQLSDVNGQIEDVVETHRQASEEYTSRIEQLLTSYEGITQTYDGCTEKQVELRKKLAETGFNAEAINQCDSLDLKMQELAGELSRHEKSVQRCANFREVFLNLTRVYAGASNSCATIVDYLHEVSEVMSTLFEGPVEMDLFITKMAYAMDITTKLGADSKNILLYTKGITDEIMRLGAPERENYDTMRQISEDAVQQSNVLLDQMAQNSSSIEDARDRMLEAYRPIPAVPDTSATLHHEAA